MRATLDDQKNRETRHQDVVIQLSISAASESVGLLSKSGPSGEEEIGGGRLDDGVGTMPSHAYLCAVFSDYTLFLNDYSWQKYYFW